MGTEETKNILEKLEARLQRRANDEFEGAISSVKSLYRQKLKINGTSLPEHKIDEAIDAAFFAQKEHYVSRIKKRMDDAFMDELGDISKLLARTLGEL